MEKELKWFVGVNLPHLQVFDFQDRFKNTFNLREAKMI